MEEDFTSGPWTGFYVYAGGRRERMDLSLSFKEGLATGSGNDPVGPFSIRGRYDAAKNEAWWTKSYLGAHDVFYKGYRDSHGIWGTWEIHAGWSGGFHIWPRGEGGLHAEAAEADVEAPVDATAPGPGRGPQEFPDSSNRESRMAGRGATARRDSPFEIRHSGNPCAAHFILDFKGSRDTITSLMKMSAARYSFWYWPR